MQKSEVLKVFHNQAANSGVPVSFWRHFAENEFTDAFEHPAVIDVNLNGHRDYLKQFDVDLVKTMLDGYFPYPFKNVTDPRKLASLKQIKPLATDDDWITKQVELAQKQRQIAGDKLTFITIFSPMILFKWALIKHYEEALTIADHRFFDLYEKDPATVKYVLDVIAQDLIKVVQALQANTDIDGIYYSTQSIQDERADNLEFFKNVMEPVDLKVQNAINESFDLNILHICGFDGAINHLEWFVDYPLQVINWATIADGYTLGEGKKLFGNRVVLGGFDNSRKGVLYAGTKAEIKNYVTQLLNEAGTDGVILGADCTIPRDTPAAHIQWAIEAAHNYQPEASDAFNR